MAHAQSEAVPRQRRADEREHHLPQGQHEGPPEVQDPGGRVDIVPTVIEKAAACAALEVAGVTTPRHRASRVRVSGRAVLLRLRIGVRYPEPVRETAARVRERVRDRVEHLTGSRVHHIDIEIVEMVR